MRTRFPLLGSGLALALFSPVALAQSEAQQRATEAFRDCREMEKYGDATPCWKRWLEKHKSAGNEAEVMVAEERSAGGKPTAPAEPPKEAQPEPEAAAPADEPEAEPEEDALEGAANEKLAEVTPGEFKTPENLPAFGELGLSLQVHGTLRYFFLDQPHYAPYGAIQAGPDSWVQQQFGLPELSYGGGGAISYDLTEATGVAGLAVRAGGEFLMGNGTATQAQIITIDLLAQMAFPVQEGIDLYGALGPTVTLAKVRAVPFYNPVVLGELDPDSGDIVAVEEMPGQKVDYAAMRFGAEALFGIAFDVTPEIALLAELPLHFSFPSAGYDSANPATMQCPTSFDANAPGTLDPNTVSTGPNQDSERCWGFGTREDTFASAGLRLGGRITF